MTIPADDERPNAPRDNLIRSAEIIEMRGEGDEQRTLTGYAAVFNADTEINSWEGNFIERIAPGAFRKTLRERKDDIQILFNHGMDPQIGDKPLGRASVMKEDSRGLFVEVPLSRTSYNEDIRELLADGAIRGMSFRFAVVKETWETPKRGLPVRTIDEAKLYEVGPVTFPAYAATSAGVRSREELSIWRSLTDEKRAAIEQVLATSPEATGEAGDEVPADEPVVDHSLRARQIKARANYFLSLNRKDIA